jgi:hypothetical protein
MVAVVTNRAGAGPLPSRPVMAMCLRLNAASIAVPSGDRLDSPAFSGARPDEGLTHDSCDVHQARQQ